MYRLYHLNACPGVRHLRPGLLLLRTLTFQFRSTHTCLGMSSQHARAVWGGTLRAASAASRELILHLCVCRRSVLAYSTLLPLWIIGLLTYSRTGSSLQNGVFGALLQRGASAQAHTRNTVCECARSVQGWAGWTAHLIQAKRDCAENVCTVAVSMPYSRRRPHVGSWCLQEKYQKEWF